MATLVRHPNVAALYDFSRLPDGSFYMVWEYIAGVTLEEWMLRHGPLPAAQALDIARQVLSGLSEIHAQGIVHRDLSPDNILVRENREGRLLAKIIDLGIAKRVAAETLSMTGTGLFVGKLKYCSPEQAGALPAGQVVDGRSDLYSFGVVLYEMLSGKPPFESQTPEGYLVQHLNSPPPPLDRARLPARTGPALAGDRAARPREEPRPPLLLGARVRRRARTRRSRGDRVSPRQTAPRDAKARRSRALAVVLVIAVSAGAVAAALYILNQPGAPVPIPAAVTTSPHPLSRRRRRPRGRTTSSSRPGSWSSRLRPSPRPRPSRRPACPSRGRFLPAPPASPPPAASPRMRRREPIEGPSPAARFRGNLEQWTRRPIARRRTGRSRSPAQRTSGPRPTPTIRFRRS